MKLRYKLTAILLAVVMTAMTFPMSVLADYVRSDDTALDTQSSAQPSTAEAEVTDEDAPLTVVYEIESLRDANSKHYRLSDGSNVAIEFSDDVHYLSDDVWEEIDNTIVEENGAYQTKEGEVEISFSDDINENELFTYGDGEHYVEFALALNDQISSGDLSLDTDNTESEETVEKRIEITNPGAIEESSGDAEVASVSEPQEDRDYTVDEIMDTFKNESSIRYVNIIDGVDIRYDVLGNTLKEYIVLKEESCGNAFSFEINAPSLFPVAEDDGSISLVDKEGTSIYAIPAPFMFDAAGEYSFDVEYSVESVKGGKYKLTVAADEEWLEDEDRVYPVAIDPAITLTKYGSVTNKDIDTRYYASRRQFESPTGTGVIYMGYDMSVDGEYYTYMKANALPSLPSNCIPVKGMFYLAHGAYDHVNMSSLTIEAHQATGSAWYSNYSSDAMDYVTLSASTLQNYLFWDVTPAVKSWYADSTSNYGVTFKATESFSSTNCAKATLAGYNNANFAPSAQPKFVVYYRNTVGLEDYYTYHTQSAGRAGVGYVRDYDARLTFVHNDLTNKSEGMPFAINSIYNSASKSHYFTYVENSVNTLDYSDMLSGKGWKLNIQETIVHKEITDINGNTSNYKIYLDSDGTEHYFYHKDTSDDGHYYDEDGLNLKIQVVSANQLDLIDEKGNRKIFWNGYLYQIKDANSNLFTINYGNRENGDNVVGDGKPSADRNRIISIIQNPAGTHEVKTLATFEYNQWDFLETITDKYGRETVISYSDMKITRITHSDGTFAKFIYDSGNRMIKAYDSESKYGIKYTYDTSRNCVTSFQEFICDDIDDIETDSALEFGALYYVETTDYGVTYVRYAGADRSTSAYSSSISSDIYDDILTTYLFDDFGRTVNAFSANKKPMDTYSSKYIVFGTTAAEYTENSIATSKKNNRLTAQAQTGGRGANLVINPGAENEMSNWTVWGDPVYAFASTVHRTGNRSFVITNGTEKTTSIQQSYTAKANGNHVLSAYVKINSFTDVEDNGGVSLRVYDSNSNELVRSTVLDEVTNPSAAGGWQRISVIADLDKDSTYLLMMCLANAKGTVYFDDFQLELDTAVSRESLLNNGSFEASHYAWVPTAGSVSYGNSTSVSMDYSTPQYLILASDSDTVSSARNTVQINGTSKAETFVLTGWAKATAVPQKPEEIEYKPDSKFELQAKAVYTDGSSKTFTAEFSRDIRNKWQYSSVMIVPEKAVSYIEVSVIYAYNNGNAYFDNISLTREDVQTYKYNDDGEVVAVNSASSEEGPTYSYDGANLISEVSPTSGTYEYEYTFENNPHLVTKVKNDGLSMEIDYIMAGLVSSTTLKGEGGTKTITTSASYEDYRDHLISSTSELGVTTTYTYGTDGNLAGVTTPVSSTTGTGNVTTSYTYVANTDKVASVYIDNLTGVAYTYDDGCLTEITRTDEETDLEQYYTFVYDDWGNTTQIKVGNRTLATYTYADGNGNLETMTYGNGVVVNYEYDKFDRVETVECDGYETRYYYSAEGSLERTEDEKSGRTTYYIYDGIGRLVRSTAYEDGNIVEDEVYCYDDLNRTSEVFTKAGTHENVQSYTYDTSDGSLTKLENENDSTTDIVEYTYDYLKRLSEKEISNGDDYLLYEYSYANRPNDNTKTTTLIDNVVVSNNDKTLNDFLYEYDNVGNIIWEDNFSDAEITYSYDELGQLVEVDDSRTAEIYKYYYDNFGNILKKETYKYGSLQSTYEYGYTDSNWRDLLTSYRGQSITYDEIGNPLSYYNGSSYTFTWSEGRKLASATVGSNAVTYNYENGNRVSKTVNGTVHNYYYVGGNLVSETWGTNSLSFLYDESGVYGFIYNNGTTTETYYYGKNLQGDIIDIYDDEMNLVAYYEYDAWGKLNAIYDDNGDTINARTNSTHPAVVNPLRYRSYYYDTEISLYFLNSRYYDAKIGRFISPDGQISGAGGDINGYNLYSYCFNNPVNMSDESGNWPRWITAAVAIVAAVVTVAAVATGNVAVATVAAKVTAVAATAYVVQSLHYDVRTKLNDNDIVPKTRTEADNKGWIGPDSDPPSPSAKCHQYTDINRKNTKYVTEDGHREAIYDSSGDLVLDSRDIGTYNIIPSGGILGTIGHITLDILPWVIFGNDDDDPGIIINTVVYTGEEIIKLFG